MPTPLATYRFQVRPDFPLAKVVEVLDLVVALGVTHVYCSPLLQAHSGSSHGYDVTDPTRIDDERGGEEGWQQLLEACRERGLGVVVDLVPNHVDVLTHENPWWWSLLRDGPGSEHDATFDLFWDEADGKVLLPVLGAPFDEVLDDLAIVGDEVHYHEHRMPLAPGSWSDGDDLRDVLERQHWRLAFWRRGADALNYRRFFDVPSLGGVRVEDEDVFDRVLGTTIRMAGEDGVDGLRIDHPDGLRDPAGFLRRLRDRVGDDTWIVVEKILEHGEQLRNWPVQGDVGYGLLNDVVELFVDPAAEAIFTRLERDVTGRAAAFDETRAGAMREIADVVLVAERDRLARMLLRVAADAGVTADLPIAQSTVTEWLVASRVYRSYVVGERDEVTDADREIADGIVERATAAGADPQLTSLLGQVLRLDHRGPTTDELVARLQQASGPVLAKGIEDTTFYRDLRLTALNEVGGHPTVFGIAPATFHAHNAARQRDWPLAMVTTSTHDTKRSEDARVRLAVVSQVPDLWERCVTAWRSDALDDLRDDALTPHAEYLAWQSAVAAWPISADRLVDYLRKATREAKLDTSHLDPDEAFEAALERYARGLVEHDGFLEPLADLLEVVLPAGRLASLSQTLLRTTVPGVPDTYQGNEAWDLSLVDPDNRRDVSFGTIRGLHRMAESGVSRHDIVESLVDRTDPGLAKLWVLRRALHLRRRLPDVFGADGAYRPLPVEGPTADAGVAFSRGDDRVLVIATTRPVSWLHARGGLAVPGQVHATTVTLPPGRYVDELVDREVTGGGTVPLDDVLDGFPLALLVRR